MLGVEKQLHVKGAFLLTKYSRGSDVHSTPSLSIKKGIIANRAIAITKRDNTNLSLIFNFNPHILRY